ncbi:MAG: T9SS type A sorting domain-containing protein [Chloroflexota bacterium]
MKKIYALVFLSFLTVGAFAQIVPFEGIYDVDSCDFETPCHLVNSDTAGNLWQLGAPDKLTFTESYSIPYAMITDTVNPYPTGADAWFELGFHMDDYFYGMDIIVGFRHKYNTDTLLDGGYIETSNDNGATWYNVINDPNIMWLITDNMYTQNDTLKGGVPGFSGTSGDWVYTQLEIIYGMPVKWPYDTLMMRFHFISDETETAKDGWMIDNLHTSYADLGSGVKNRVLEQVSVNPNPFTDHTMLTFNNPKGELLTIELVNSEGLSVKTYTTRHNSLQVDRGTLQPGLCLVKLIKNGTLTGTGKIIVK